MTTDYHFDRTIVLSEESKHKGLYEWFFAELDETGKRVGRDYIPWQWSSHFRASSITFSDSVDSDLRGLGLDGDRAVTTYSSVSLRATIVPGSSPEDDPPSFSMMGTGRSIKNFELILNPVGQEDEQEFCLVWGSVSYTSEIDFSYETIDDCLCFYAYISAPQFERYVSMVKRGEVNEVLFTVGGADGFYSEWSPSISTDLVKVLPRGDEFKVISKDGCTISPPKLNRALKFKIQFRKNLAL